MLAESTLPIAKPFLLEKFLLPVNLNLLRQSLEEHVPFDLDELQTKKSILALVEHSRIPSDRNQFNPGHITASAFVATKNKSHIILILHRKLSRWLQPGGHIEPQDSSVLEAATREVEEEVGLHLIPSDGQLFDLDIHHIPESKSEPAHKHFDIRFLFVVDRCNLTVGSDVVDAQWISLENWGAMEVDSGLARIKKKLAEK